MNDNDGIDDDDDDDDDVVTHNTLEMRSELY